LPRKVVETYDVLHLTVSDATGHQLWTWSVPRNEPAATAERTETLGLDKHELPPSDRTIVESGPYSLTFDNETGVLKQVRRGTRVYPLSDGPRPIVYRRKQREFEAVAELGKLRSFEIADAQAAPLIATATYDGVLQKVSWSRSGDGFLLSYQLAYEGTADIFGVQFALPEDAVKSKRWVGHGPYRVWQNRLKGGVFDLHETAYNDATPGEAYAYPEFKGYFGAWRWLELTTSAGRIIIENASAVPHFGLYRPRGGTQPVLALPDVGVSFLSVIPAMGTKFQEPGTLGPQSQPRNAFSGHHGSLRFRFD
jgi:hypothetical protein